MKKIMMSVSPVYFEQIVNGEKRYEYRKKRCRDTISAIVLYVGRPVSKVLGEIEVDEPIEGTPDEIWSATGDFSGVSKEMLLLYCNDKKTVYAYPIKRVNMYDKPRRLQEYGKKYPPQSFYYL